MEELTGELKESVTELMSVLQTEIQEKNRLLLETQHFLLIQQEIAARAYERIKVLETQLDI